MIWKVVIAILQVPESSRMGLGVEVPFNKGGPERKNENS